MSATGSFRNVLSERDHEDAWKEVLTCDTPGQFWNTPGTGTHGLGLCRFARSIERRVLARLDDEAPLGAGELAAARETIRRLNRRCQSAEQGLAQKIDEMQRAGRSMGRAFANSAATMYREQLADANAKLQAVAADAARLLDHMNTVPDIANAAVPFIERVAALKLEVQDA